MAKSKGGLPDNFDIGVTAKDLQGPVKLPGYLDDFDYSSIRTVPKPVVEQRVTATLIEMAPPVVTPDSTVPMTTPDDIASEVRPQVSSAAPVTQVVEESPKEIEAIQVFVAPQDSSAPKTQTQGKNLEPQEIRRRLQINLDADGERMVNELLDLLSNQSAEHRIKVSELFQALIVNLYNAKGEIVLGSLPVRGRWGSITAKAFPLALAESLREAIVAQDTAIGGNPFKKAVGG